MKKGNITLVIGSMFSGKTSYLIKVAKEYQEKKKRIQIYYPAVDKRYKEKSITSHDQISVTAIPVNDVTEIPLTDCDMVIIDEVQFFDPSVVLRIQQLRDNGISVIAAGLNRDYMGKSFLVTKEIESIGVKTIKLFAKCILCSAEAEFNQRMRDGHEVTELEEIIQIGGTDSYQPRCKKCFVSNETILQII